MKRNTSRLSAAIAFALTAWTLALTPAHLTAQIGSGGGIFVAIPEAFPEIEARAVIIREGRGDVVLLRAGEATPEALAMSLVVLRRVRGEDPAPKNGQMIPITGFVITSPMSQAYRADLASVLDRLARRPTTEVGNLGPGKWVRFEG